MSGAITSARAVSDGNKVRFTLEQVETKNPQRVRIDWLRFTLSVDSFKPTFSPDFDGVADVVDQFEAARTMHEVWRPINVPGEVVALANRVAAVDGGMLWTGACEVARQGACALVELIGVFIVGTPEVSGMDFYAARCPLIYEGATVGYVLAGGRDSRQADTVHFNLFGAACLHLQPGHLRKIADWIDRENGWITRADLSLDVWSGLDVVDVQAAWCAGAFNVRGKRPGQREVGSWSAGHSRTFEVGSRGTGKLLRAYEKGDQLFGPEANDPWVRLEVEFRASHRIVETCVLRRPADFFAGAYPWLAEFVAALDIGASAQTIPTNAEVKDAHAEAAAARVVKWVMHTAGPAVTALWDLGGDLIADIVQINQSKGRQTKRLRGFAVQDIRDAFEKVASAIAPPCAHSLNGA